MTNLKVKRLHVDAQIPKYASNGAACFDLKAVTCEGSVQSNGNKGWKHVMDGYTATIFGTCLSFEIPAGHVMLIFSRSGQGFSEGIRLSNCVGVIDSK